MAVDVARAFVVGGDFGTLSGRALVVRGDVILSPPWPDHTAHSNVSW